MVPRVGQRIGPYEILGRLGSGGMGLVFSAWDARLQRDVAIKLLRDEYSSPDMRQRFLQEARAASGLNHPNICTIFDIGEQGGDPYLVMELLKGETLRARIASGSISADDITRVATEVADALIVAHTRGIIHRDIKPANIILVDKPGGRFGTKVLDFGLAKVDLGDGFDNRFDLTSVGSTVGTVSYMSPEQARGEQLDARSDLFSLGVVLYEMATGQLPFRGATSALVFVQLLSQPPDPPREVNAAIPKDLERIILKMLEKDRNNRFQSAAELVETLHKIPIRGGAAGRSIWGAIPSLVRSRPDVPVARMPPETVPVAPRPAPADVDRPRTPVPPATPPPSPPPTPVPPPRPVVGESILRPVKRVVTSDPQMVAATAVPPRPPSDPPTPPPATPSPEPPASRPDIPVKTSGSVPVAISTDRPSSAPGAPSSSGSVTPVPRSSQRLQPASRFQNRDIDDFTPPPSSRSDSRVRTPGNGSRTAPRLIIVGIVVAVAAVAAWLFWPKHSAPVVNTSTALAIAHISNSTGDNELTDVLAAGLQFDLEQSTRFDVRNPGSLAAGFQALNLPYTQDAAPALTDAREAAKAIGVNQVVYGEINSAGASSYTVILHVYDTATGAKTADPSETAATREQVPDTIDRLASGIRAALGETGDALRANPLSKEATPNLDALQDYTVGVSQMDSGSFDAAMTSFQSATKADANFTQAHLQLAELYRRQRASIASAQEAALAQKDSVYASQRTQLLAQASYQLNASGDYIKATDSLQKLLNTYPGDAQASYQLATVLRLQGRFADSLTAAQRILAQDPYDVDAAGAAALAMLVLNPSTTEGAEHIEAQVRKSGRSHPGLRVLLNALGSRDNGQVGVDLSNDGDRIGANQYQASLDDAGGLLSGGLSEWRALAAHAASRPELVSAASEELSNAAINRALIGDCPSALGLVHEAASYPQGLNTLFNSGMTDALCGQPDAAKSERDNIQKNYPESFAAKGYLVPDLNATIQWKSNDGAGALKTLQATNMYDDISYSRYLRAKILLDAKEPLKANVDFNLMLERRAGTTLINPVLYPLAQIGFARALLANHDVNSGAAYAKFLQQWRGADSNQELVREARQNAR